MNFTDLYRFANGLTGNAIPVEQLRTKVRDDHPTVHDVIFWACELDPQVSLGHMVLKLDRSSAYDDEFIVADIRFDRGLNLCWQRFVCCKELMHVFDRSLEKTSDKARFLKLMSELENNPIASDSSPMFTSERNAEWMALFALCPARLRSHYAGLQQTQGLTNYDIALRLRIPEIYVKAILSSHYGRVLELLTGEAA